MTGLNEVTPIQITSFLLIFLE